ncbi:MAG TPA: AMP-dependent synthetase, partial [Marmoricola sp.]|nr:AMP-dependent synthetase [Marmoricola sp.]
VEEVAVYGVPHEEWGQSVAAAVVGSATVTELQDWASTRLAPPKRPKAWQLMDSLPHTSTGKIRRRELGPQPAPGFPENH